MYHSHITDSGRRESYIKNLVFVFVFEYNQSCENDDAKKFKYIFLILGLRKQSIEKIGSITKWCTLAPETGKANFEKAAKNSCFLNDK